MRPVAGGGAARSFCFFCGAAGAADATCPSCLVPMPRLSCGGCGRASPPSALVCGGCAAPLVEPRVTSPCPRCTSPLTAVAIDGAATIHACLSCRGIFVPPRAWCAAAARPELVTAIAARFPERPVPAAARIPLLRCPVCARELDRGRFAATAPVVVDVCPHHHGVWLDSGELGGIASFAKLRAAVGPDEARRATERVEHRATYRLERTKLELEAAAAQARIQASPRFKTTAKRSGLAILAVLLLARVLFGLYWSRSAAPELDGSQRAAEQTQSVLAP